MELDPRLNFAREALHVDAHAILRSAEKLDTGFLLALDLLDACAGKVLTTGVGKSGIAARKIAATLTSTGCPAIFLHPSEAMHGDLGIVAEDDVIIALSHSGESEELLAILPALLARNVRIIALVGEANSTLAQKAAVVIDASVEREACPLNLAPTTSVVVAMALGDALAMSLQRRRGFRAEDYARNHPGGRLGRRLTLRVKDVMPGGSDTLPAVAVDTQLMDVLCEITAKAMGAACVISESGELLGIITDNDFRRAVQRTGAVNTGCVAGEMMNASPSVVLHPDQLAFEALRCMEDRPRPISVAPVVDGSNICIGMIRVHDLLRSGL